jgi:hypothetical protein
VRIIGFARREFIQFPWNVGVQAVAEEIEGQTEFAAAVAVGPIQN